MVRYYWRFIPHFATKAEPLTALTKKGQPDQVTWTSWEAEAVELLKKDLINAVMLKNPDFSKPFQLQTDASDVGVGAVLSQGGDQDQPIANFSRKILDRERNYSTIEKECLAIVLGIKAFATYLVGKPFILQTDHYALTWLQTFQDKNMRLTRWSLALQPYTFEIQHRKGRNNAKCRCLSRLPGKVKTDQCFALQKEGSNVTDNIHRASGSGQASRSLNQEQKRTNHKTGKGIPKWSSDSE